MTPLISKKCAPRRCAAYCGNNREKTSPACTGNRFLACPCSHRIAPARADDRPRTQMIAPCACRPNRSVLRKTQIGALGCTGRFNRRSSSPERAAQSKFNLIRRNRREKVLRSVFLRLNPHSGIIQTFSSGRFRQKQTSPN